LDKLKKVYYHARGWDENGLPTKKLLKKLKLDMPSLISCGGDSNE